MENQEKELKVEIIDNNPRKKVMEQQEQERRQQEIEIKKRAIKRQRKKKKIKIILIGTAIATIITGGVILGGIKLHSMITDSKNSQEKIMATINKVIDEKEQEDALTIENYEQKSEALEQEMINLTQDSNEELANEAKNTQEKIDASISKLSNEMMKKLKSFSTAEVERCSKRTDSKEYSFYDFSLYRKKFVILSWLGNYFEEEQIENIYNTLTKEEIEALILSTSYKQINQYENGPDNRGNFIRSIASNESNQSNQEIFEQSKETSDKATFKVAKEYLSQKLGYSLDVETQSVGKGL